MSGLGAFSRAGPQDPSLSPGRGGSDPASPTATRPAGPARGPSPSSGRRRRAGLPVSSGRGGRGGRLPAGRCSGRVETVAAGGPPITCPPTHPPTHPPSNRSSVGQGWRPLGSPPATVRREGETPTRRWVGGWVIQRGSEYHPTAGAPCGLVRQMIGRLEPHIETDWGGRGRGFHNREEVKEREKERERERTRERERERETERETERKRERETES